MSLVFFFLEKSVLSRDALGSDCNDNKENPIGSADRHCPAYRSHRAYPYAHSGCLTYSRLSKRPRTNHQVPPPAPLVLSLPATPVAPTTRGALTLSSLSDDVRLLFLSLFFSRKFPYSSWLQVSDSNDTRRNIGSADRPLVMNRVRIPLVALSLPPPPTHTWVDKASSCRETSHERSKHRIWPMSFHHKSCPRPPRPHRSRRRRAVNPCCRRYPWPMEVAGHLDASE